MAIVRRRNRDGSWSFQARVKGADGKWLPTAVQATLEAAKSEEARLFAAKKKRSRGSAEDARVTLNDYWDVWSVDCRQSVGAGWKISQDQMWRDYLQPVVGEKRLCEVDASDISQIFIRMDGLKTNRGKPPAAQTKKHVYSLVRSMFADAVEFYEIPITSPVKARFHCPKVRTVKRAFLPPALSSLLLEAARAHEYLGPPVWVELLAGLRQEAMQALRWDAVIWDRDQILICRAWKQKVRRIEEFPKGKDWEYVPMIPELKSYLWEKWLASERDPLAFVCQGPSGGMLSRHTYRHALDRLLKSAGLPRVTPHELRHSTSELFVEAGASETDIQRILNHKSPTTTRRYMHRTDDRLFRIAGNVGAHLRLVSSGAVSQEGFPNGKLEEVRVTPEGETRSVSC